MEDDALERITAAVLDELTASAWLIGAAMMDLAVWSGAGRA